MAPAVHTPVGMAPGRADLEGAIVRMHRDVENAERAGDHSRRVIDEATAWIDRTRSALERRTLRETARGDRTCSGERRFRC